MRISPQLTILSVALLLVGPLAAAHAAPFTFAGHTFDSAKSADTIGLLGNSQNLGGVAFSSGYANRITDSVGFGAQSIGPGGVYNPAPGWTSGLSIGELAYSQLGVTQGDGTGSTFSSALNLPALNNGATTRHGLSLSWSSGQGLVNGTGTDFVVYESGSLGTPEAFMVRLGLGGGLFTDWFYQANSGFESFLGEPDGAFAHAFDLSNFGLAAGDVALSIEIANMMPGDLVGAGGRIGSGAPLGIPPGNFDPDLLYMGIVGQIGPVAAQEVPEPVSLAIWSLMSVAGMAALRRRKAVVAA